MLKIKERLETKINKDLINFCEILPYNATLFEKEGLCTKPNERCKYCKEIKNKESFLCNKKTYIYKNNIESCIG